MAYIAERGNSYGVRYTYETSTAELRQMGELSHPKEEATNRKSKSSMVAAGTFPDPVLVTVAEFLDGLAAEVVQQNTSGHQTYESTFHHSGISLSPISAAWRCRSSSPYHMEKLYDPEQNALWFVYRGQAGGTTSLKQRFLSGNDP